jgi:hypothetical protein
MEGVKIVALCIVAAVLYGIAHDQITSRVCVEYFTLAHPRIIASESPTALGLLWGVIATWWVGLGLGLALAAVARLGRRRKLDARSLSGPIALVLLGTATVATAAGFAASRVAWLNPGLITVPDLDLPRGREPSFVAVAAAHAASYASGFFGGLLVLGWALSRRLSSPPAGSTPPRSGPEGNLVS